MDELSGTARSPQLSLFHMHVQDACKPDMSPAFPHVQSTPR